MIKYDSNNKNGKNVQILNLTNLLLFDKLKSIGCAHGKHDVYRQCSVIVGCTKFNNTYDSDDTVN